MPAPKLPTWQDCHELWSKKRRRRQMRDQGLPAPVPTAMPQSAIPVGTKSKADNEGA